MLAESDAKLHIHFTDRGFHRQAINKKDAKVFNNADAQLLQGITSQAGIALTNANLYNVERQSRITSEALVEVAKSLSSELRSVQPPLYVQL